jgi:hypothetical protein
MRKKKNLRMKEGRGAISQISDPNMKRPHHRYLRIWIPQSLYRLVHVLHGTSSLALATLAEKKPSLII